MVASLSQVSAFMESQQRMQMERDSQAKAERAELESKWEAQLERQRRELDAQRREMEAKLAAQRQEYEVKLRDCEAKLHAQAKHCASDVQLERLQERFDALHQAKLLTDDEMCALEDKVADFIECRSSVTVASREIDASAESMRKLVGMCEAVTKDSMLARQLRRKLL
eukprot:COSAG02_NODE_25631_length_653_cov_0.754513_1_plen_168_part_01